MGLRMVNSLGGFESVGLVASGVSVRGALTTSPSVLPAPFFFCPPAVLPGVPHYVFLCCLPPLFVMLSEATLLVSLSFQGG